MGNKALPEKNAGQAGPDSLPVGWEFKHLKTCRQEPTGMNAQIQGRTLSVLNGPEAPLKFLQISGITGISRAPTCKAASKRRIFDFICHFMSVKSNDFLQFSE
jgi:hypothetical protein